MIVLRLSTTKHHVKTKTHICVHRNIFVFLHHFGHTLNLPPIEKKYQNDNTGNIESIKFNDCTCALCMNYVNMNILRLVMTGNFQLSCFQSTISIFQHLNLSDEDEHFLCVLGFQHVVTHDHIESGL